MVPPIVAATAVVRNDVSQHGPGRPRRDHGTGRRMIVNVNKLIAIFEWNMEHL